MATLRLRMLGLVGALLAVGGAQASTPPPDLARGRYVPGEVLVKFRPQADAGVRARSIGGRGNRVVREVGRSGVVQVRLAPGETVAAALDAFQRDPNVEYAQPNYRYRAFAVPNDPAYDQLWGLNNTGQIVAGGTYPQSIRLAGRDMGAREAWDVETDCSAVVVAVLDTGVNYNHSDLAANMWTGLPNHGADFVDDDDDPMDEHGHGTHVAGTIGAVGNNGNGTTGVCWRAQLMAVRVLDAAGSGTTAWIVAGIDFAVDRGAKVINLSLGGSLFDQAMSDAIADARTAGVVVVAAAGNETNNNNTSPRYPCNFTHDNIVCVAALDQAYRLATFSNYGSATVDVGAPGTNIRSTWPGATIADTFDTGWSATTTTSGGWAYGEPFGPAFPMLLNPPTWDTGAYNNNTDDRVYKTFDLSGADLVTLAFGLFLDTRAGDVFSVAYRATGGDPFAGGVLVDSGSGSTGGFAEFRAYNVSGCIAPTCSVGFRLDTDAALTDFGVALFDFHLQAVEFDANRYDVIHGTSMATPHVSGLAALLFAYNPTYGYLDVVESIKNGGTLEQALSGKTTTGRAVNAMGSLAYIRQPTGVVAMPEP